MTSTGTDADKAAIASLTQRVTAAWAYHDGDAFADLFTEDGTMILAGQFAKGREAIRVFLKDAYAGEYRGTQVTGKPVDLRFLSPDAAILLTSGGVLYPGESEVAGRNAIRATWTAVKEAGEWKLAAYQNTPRDKAGAAQG
ncbi:SgcJ/EcaC family oxidoreductase [Amycolatopsis rubida]|uniref:SgcJ/EcaC family oxidoreductase n=1 Tax=Amycolatopsis rubida TaxID=112413 RepID=A0ABX0BR78_9PSEU|nr:MULTISPECIES: SgcJ/EcaC family oxidoreductase [Amycolatopsis]MYW93048.1 SgcJ/EcaC family oxidoreductase [Amycolatopsis rubida]NEC58035.1 SgcJ/EcaC family oxidoreductase [Amycolatopsis rubida]OAP20962.1 SnoaL-like domain protein [Amycolatopsis sp. M39]